MTIDKTRITLYLLLLTISLPTTVSFGVNLGPLYHPVKNSKYEREFMALGPFITYRKNGGYSEFGFNPFYHRILKERENIEEYEFLYPLASYKKKGNFSWFQYQLFLLTYNTEITPSGYKNKEFNLFPFIFYNNEEDKNNNYFAFFPFYGGLKNKFAKENIKFLLFPLYMKTISGGEITRSIMWPIVSNYDGELEGSRLFPIISKRVNKKKKRREEFLFWPIYIKKEKDFYGETSYFKSIFPLYSEIRSHGVSNRGYLWPFVQHTVNHKKGDERWDTPWPFINFTRGETTNQTKIFPFYSKAERNENDEDGYILLPLYKYKKISLANYRRHKKSLFLFLYKDTREEPLTDTVKPRIRIDLWPIFSFRKDDTGYSRFHIFTVFEPFINNNERLYRNFASLWRIFVWEKTADNLTRTSFLWNLVTFYSNSSEFTLDIRPIVTLFNYSRSSSGKSWNILGGLIGYESKNEKNNLKLLYIKM